MRLRFLVFYTGFRLLPALLGLGLGLSFGHNLPRAHRVGHHALALRVAGNDQVEDNAHNNAQADVGEAEGGVANHRAANGHCLEIFRLLTAKQASLIRITSSDSLEIFCCDIGLAIKNIV